MDKNKFPTWELEIKYQNEGYKNIAGIDEAGRGPLAGPVVAACVILPVGIEIKGINDSKKLSSKKRNEFFDIIHSNAIDIGVGIISEKIIDDINIYQATILAMKKAISELKQQSPDFLLIDGLCLKNFHIPNDKIIRGDSLSISIAAASIIAKVTRDRIMEEFDKIYPLYNFAKHKGYGTKCHLESIIKYGATNIHRKTFRGVKKQ